MQSDFDSFVHSLAQNPGDVTLWLVFADWLDDQGSHEAARKIRFWYKVVYPAAFPVWKNCEPKGGIREFVSTMLKRIRAEGTVNIEKLEKAPGFWWRLTSVMVHRWMENEYPLDFQGIQEWPPGWPHERFQNIINRLRLDIELQAFDLIHEDQIEIPPEWNDKSNVIWCRDLTHSHEGFRFCRLSALARALVVLIHKPSKAADDYHAICCISLLSDYIVTWNILFRQNKKSPESFDLADGLYKWIGDLVERFNAGSPEKI